MFRKYGLVAPLVSIPLPELIDMDPVVVTVIMSDPSNVFPLFSVDCAEFMVKC